MKRPPDVEKGGKWVGGDGTMIEWTIFIEHGALRVTKANLT